LIPRVLVVTRQSARTPGRRPASRERAKREVRPLWVQMAAPTCPEDLGAAEPVFYFVEDGLLTICDEAGRITGKSVRLGQSDDPPLIAGRLKRAALALTHSDFNRRLNYQPLGIA